VQASSVWRLSVAKLPFVDTHIHLWDSTQPDLRYFFLDPGFTHPVGGTMGAMKSFFYRSSDFLGEVRLANVAKAIHVEVGRATPDPVSETRWVQSEADRTGFPQGIVVRCELAQPDADEQLARHAAFRNVRGVRNPPPGPKYMNSYMESPQWIAGFRHLRKYNLVGCIYTRWNLVDDVVALAQAVPDVQMSIDHCAFPESLDATYFENWRRGIKRLAELDNAIIKISGLHQMNHHWTMEGIRPWVLASIEAFGVERVVFAADWPVARGYSSYPDAVNAYAAIISDFSPAEQTKLFSGNAERIFRI
jgi:predicted TIM-barrel fold metal-dependent hydrolase